MRVDLGDILEEGERVLWKRPPRGGAVRRALLAVRVVGHVLLSVVSVLFAAIAPLEAPLRVALGAVLVVATNAPLVAWTLYRWPSVSRRGNVTVFVTDRRVGVLRPSGELRQAPICAGLRVLVRAGTIQFILRDRALVSVGGLGQDELVLLAALVERLVKKAGASGEGRA